MAHAINIAVALAERGDLDAFVTTIAYRPDGTLGRLMRALPGDLSQRLERQLQRRTIPELVPASIRSHPMWEVLRLLAQKLHPDPRLVDAIWDRSSYSFDRLVARRYVPHTSAVHCFEYTAKASFETAERRGVARVLHLPALDYREFEELQRRERDQWPELATPYDAYFDGKLERRLDRRRSEIALADVLVTNSSLTARSHIEAGADPAKVFVAKLGAPRPISHIEYATGRERPPLRVVYAGPFSLRKGAHYLLKAWRMLRAGASARLDVYGVQALPPRLLAAEADGVVFHGAVSQEVLFAAYEAADVLVFPTLSDGFGMVVVEAMAHGCPVITTDRAGAADLVIPDNGIVVPAADSAALHRSLQWCLDNRAALAAMREPALAAARARQWSDFRRDLIEALDTGLLRAGYGAPSQVQTAC